MQKKLLNRVSLFAICLETSKKHQKNSPKGMVQQTKKGKLSTFCG